MSPSDDTPQTQQPRMAGWHFHPVLPLKISPYFILPVRLTEMLRWLVRSWLPLTERLLFLGLAPLLLIVLFFIKSKDHFSRFFLLLGCTHVSYVILVGGDVFGHGRFFILLLPTLVFVTLYEINKSSLSYNKESLKISLLSVIVLLTIVGNYQLILRSTLQSERDSAAVEQIRVLHKVSERLDPSDGSIGMHYLGVSYHIPEFHVVDFLGKAEPYIASTPPKYGPIGHNRWDYQYAFERYNIAVVPITDSMVLEVSSPQFTLTQRNFMFWQECVQLMLHSGAYVYLSSEYFGNSSFGAFVRKDLAEKFQ